jgi:predicted DNA-binding transcriptional regulator AlpA
MNTDTATPTAQRKHTTLPLDWNNPEAQDRLTDVDVLAAFIGAGVSTIYRLVEAGVIAKPIKIGRLARWRYSYVKSLANGLPVVKVKAKAA